MIAYTRDELISVSELAKNPNKILNSIRNSSRKKVAVVRNDKLEAVIMSVREYERIIEASELAEHTEIYQIIKAREQTPVSEYIDHEDIPRFEKYKKNSVRP